MLPISPMIITPDGKQWRFAVDPTFTMVTLEGTLDGKWVTFRHVTDLLPDVGVTVGNGGLLFVDADVVLDRLRSETETTDCSVVHFVGQDRNAKLTARGRDIAHGKLARANPPDSKEDRYMRIGGHMRVGDQAYPTSNQIGEDAPTINGRIGPSEFDKRSATFKTFTYAHAGEPLRAMAESEYHWMLRKSDHIAPDPEHHLLRYAIEQYLPLAAADERVEMFRWLDAAARSLYANRIPAAPMAVRRATSVLSFAMELDVAATAAEMVCPGWWGAATGRDWPRATSSGAFSGVVTSTEERRDDKTTLVAESLDRRVVDHVVTTQPSSAISIARKLRDAFWLLQDSAKAISVLRALLDPPADVGWTKSPLENAREIVALRPWLDSIGNRMTEFPTIMVHELDSTPEAEETFPAAELKRVVLELDQEQLDALANARVWAMSDPRFTGWRKFIGLVDYLRGDTAKGDPWCPECRQTAEAARTAGKLGYARCARCVQEERRPPVSRDEAIRLARECRMRNTPICDDPDGGTLEVVTRDDFVAEEWVLDAIREASR